MVPGNSLLSSNPCGTYVGKQATTYTLFIQKKKNILRQKVEVHVLNPSTEAAGPGGFLVFEGYIEGGRDPFSKNKIKYKRNFKECCGAVLCR